MTEASTVEADRLDPNGDDRSLAEERTGPIGLWAFGIPMFVIIAAGWFLRRAACGESLWVDELHSAWVVSGTFSELVERSEVGHQTPWYFAGIWAWCQLFGTSDWTIRLPSLILSLAGCGVIGLAGYQLTGRWIVGVVAGCAMAIERNGLFYGTEARGYAAVLFAMTVVIWGTLFLMNAGVSSKVSRLRTCAILFALFMASFVATLVHVTAAWSIAALGSSAAIVILFRVLQSANETRKPLEATSPFRREQFRRLILLLVMLGGGSAVALALHVPYLSRTWEHRDLWQSFATAKSIEEVGTLWPWLWCFVVPSVFAMMAPQARKSGKNARHWRMVAVLGLAIGSATLLAWFVASQGWIALWHRRFLIGLLPMVYLLGGLMWGWADFRWKQGIETKMRRGRGRLGIRQKESRRRFRHQESRGRGLSAPFALSVGIATVLIAAIVTILSDGTWRYVIKGESKWVYRGEDWRGAARYIQSNRSPEDMVWLDAGLIESHWLSNRMFSDLSPIEQQYLTFPLISIYAVGTGEETPCVAVGSIRAVDFPRQWSEESIRTFPGSQTGDIEENVATEKKLWLVVRSNARLVEKAVGEWIEAWNAERGAGDPLLRLDASLESFGNVTVGRVRME